MTEAIQVLVCVSGGVAQTAYATPGVQLDFKVLDFDDAMEDESQNLDQEFPDSTKKPEAVY